jgi:hypothetical protein
MNDDNDRIAEDGDVDSFDNDNDDSFDNDYDDSFDNDYDDMNQWSKND